MEWEKIFATDATFTSRVLLQFVCVFGFGDGGDSSCCPCSHYNIATAPLKRWVCLPSPGSGLAVWFSLTNSISLLMEMILSSRGLQGFFSLLLDGGTETSMLWNLEWMYHLETEARFCQAPSHPACWMQPHGDCVRPAEQPPHHATESRRNHKSLFEVTKFQVDLLQSGWWLRHTCPHQQDKPGMWQEVGLLCFWNYCPGTGEPFSIHLQSDSH